MKKYKVNGKVVVADSLREAIVKFRDDQSIDLEQIAHRSLNPRNIIFSAGQKFRDPKGNIWEVKGRSGELLTMAINGKINPMKLNNDIFASFSEDWRTVDSADSADSMRNGKLVVETYCINKGQPGEYYGLKTDEGDVLHYAPNNWKTESAAIKWALNHGYAVNDSVKDSEAEEIAKRIRNSSQWNEKDLKRLCELAGLSKEWQNADGENFESVVYQAAKRLGVDIDDSADSVKDEDAIFYRKQRYVPLPNYKFLTRITINNKDWFFTVNNEKEAKNIIDFAVDHPYEFMEKYKDGPHS